MKNITTQKLFARVVLFLISTILTSCGVWADFTTYFNTYYNARTLFDETEKAILLQKKDPFIFRDDQPNQLTNTAAQQNAARQTSITNPGQTTGAQRTQTGGQTQYYQDLTKVIEKCSKILQFEQESSFFDDALFMTGKAFYYQGEYARAQRKFLELETVPESDYASENKLWLAKTHLQLRNFEEGLSLIEKVKADAIADEDEELFLSASITKIGFYVYREEYSNAIVESQTLLKNLDDDEMTALVYYQMGKIYMEQGDEENALNAYSSVLEYSPTFEIEFESRMQHALLLKDLDKLDESEEELNSLLEGGKFINEMDRIMVELGTIYYEKGDKEKAVNTFIEVDSTYKNTIASGTACFMLGEIYEKEFGVYDSAFKYYNKTVTSLAPYDMKVDAGTNVRNIDKYFGLKKTIAGFERSYLYLSEPTKFMQDSIDYALAYDEYLKDVTFKVDSVVASVQSTQVVTETQKKVYEQQVQSMMQQAELRNAGSRPEDYRTSLKELIVQGKVNKPVMPAIKKDSIKVLLSREYYNLGSLFYSELEVPDSAFVYFDIILKDFYGKPVTVPTLFALGTYYETSNQKEKADSMFTIIYEDFPKNPLFNEAAIKLGKLNKEEKKFVASGIDPAQDEYVGAEKKYFDGNYREAIDRLTKVYLSYPKSPFMPKALYFIGLIYEEQFKDYDSAAVFYAILSSKEYSNTPYGKVVSAKYLEYKKVKDAEEAEKQKILDAQLKLEQEKGLLDSAKVIQDSSFVEKKLNGGKLENGVLEKEKGLIDSTKNLPDSPANMEEALDRGLRNKLLEKENIPPDTSKIIPDTSAVKKGIKDDKLGNEVLNKEEIKKDTIDSKEDERREAFRKKPETAAPDSVKKNPAHE